MMLKRGKIASEVDVVECESLADKPVAVGERPREHPPRRDQQSGLYHNETLFAFPFAFPDAGLPADPPTCANEVRVARLYQPARQTVVVSRVRNRLPQLGRRLFSSGTGRAMCFRSAKSKGY